MRHGWSAAPPSGSPSWARAALLYPRSGLPLAPAPGTPQPEEAGGPGPRPARVPKSASLRLRLASGDKQLRGTAPRPAASEAAMARAAPTPKPRPSSWSVPVQGGWAASSGAPVAATLLLSRFCDRDRHPRLPERWHKPAVLRLSAPFQVDTGPCLHCLSKGELLILKR